MNSNPNTALLPVSIDVRNNIIVIIGFTGNNFDLYLKYPSGIFELIPCTEKEAGRFFRIINE